MSEKLHIHQAAVLGAGVMGAQIAAHLTNAGIPTILFDLASEKDDPNKIVLESLKSLKNLKPLPLGEEGLETQIMAANYNTDLEKLKNCNLVIEAISERFDWKENLYKKVSPYLAKNVIFGTNTSGLNIHRLASVLPQELQSRFCGIHFFNPPRYMKLVEIIPHPKTDLTLLEQLEVFLVTNLGKGVVYAKDTPNFIGNRIGVFSLLSTVYHSKELGLSPDVVDMLTGTLIGRPKSATFRTMDVVGLDTIAHVVNTLKQELTDDPWASYFTLPDWISKLIEKGALGQKKGAGVYKKVDDQILVYDFHDQKYRPTSTRMDDEVVSIFAQKDPAVRFKSLQTAKSVQAQFLWRIFRDLFQYCAYHLEAIADTVRDVDLAMRWGYGWQQGPFEIWQQAGWQDLAKALESEPPLPLWVHQPAWKGPYHNGKAFSPAKKTFEARSNLEVYRRQFFPDAMLTDHFDTGETVFETSAVRMWTLGDKIPILSFKTKRNSIDPAVLEGIQEAIARAEKDFDALVLWQESGDFSVGANLKLVNELQNRGSEVEDFVSSFQKTAQALRYSQVPIVAAIQGLTLGGGCELSMHATRIVASFETYIGLVEVGVGLIPAGAGSKELAYRASQLASSSLELFKVLSVLFEQVVRARVSTSALDARRLHYLGPSDVIIFNPQELLFHAKKEAHCLAESNYCPPLKPVFPVMGKSGIANLKAQLVNFREGDFISDHDYLICAKIAHVMCGGEVEEGALVDENWMLRLEREAILSLIETSETMDRIKYMLEKGKPLRN